MNIASTLGGLAGACALTLLNEGVKKIDSNAPRLDLLGQNAMAKLMKGNTVIPQTARQIAPLAGDLVTNSLYYAMARGSNNGNTFLRGALLGLTAGVGALTLPQTMGLDSSPTTRSNKTKLMTIGWYLIGGLVAAAVINALNKYPTAQESDVEMKQSTASAGKTAVKEGIKSIVHA
jgi:hypothetical protein